MSIAVHAPAQLRGTPLVLLHAFPLDSTMWDPVVDALGDLPVLAVDAPGFGASEPQQPGLEGYARQIVTYLREHGAQRAVVAGPGANQGIVA